MTAESWNDRYRKGEHASNAPLPFLVEGLKDIPSAGRAALDLACGTGRHSLLLAKYGWQVTAVDWSEAALETIHAENVVTQKADLEHFTIQPAAWDLICVTYYLDRTLLPQIIEGLKPEGVIAAAFPVEDARPGIKPMNPAFLLKTGELATLFPGFAILHSAEVETAASRRRAELIAYRPTAKTK